MITPDTVAAALRCSTERRLHHGDWFSNGHFAIRGAQWAAMGTEVKDGIATLVESVSQKKTDLVTEAVDIRIPRKTVNHRCEECSLGEVKHEDCDSCAGHVCENCNGTGKEEVVEDVGQAVFAGERGETVVNPQYGALLDGLTVRRDEADEPGRAALFGYDAAGDLVAIVMPMFVESVRRIKVTAIGGAR